MTKNEFEALKKEASAGYADAQYKLSLCYFEGRCVPLNYQTAFEWAKKAAEQNHLFGLSRVARMLRDGKKYNIPEDRAAALKLFEKAGELGYVCAKKDAARIYEKDGDFENALVWWTHAGCGKGISRCEKKIEELKSL